MMEKKSRRTSTMWKFFTLVQEDKAMCDLCKQIISCKSSITNLRSHLSRKHKTMVLASPSFDSTDPKPSTIKKIMPALKLEQTALQHKVKWTEVAQDSTLPAVVRLNIPQESFQTVAKSCENKIGIVNAYGFSNPIRSKTDSALMKLFINDFQPYSIVDNEGFREFVKELNHNYKLPSQEIISKTHIPALHEKCLAIAKELAKNISKVCLTTDFWTSQNGDIFMALTGHFIDESFDLKSILLECSIMDENYTSTDLEKSLKRIVQEWNLENKIVLTVSNNDNIIVNALRKELNVKNMCFFSETLNLAICNALNIHSISELLNKVRSIAAYFKGNVQANEELLSFQQSHGFTSAKKLITDSTKQWYTTFNMLETFVELEDAVRAIDANVPHLDEQEWLITNELIKVLQPFEAVTKIINEENYKIASFIIVITNGLLEGCKEMQNMHISDDVKLFAEHLCEELNSRVGDVECSETLGITTYLDPRFKDAAFQDEEAETWVRDNIVRLVDQLKPINRPTNIKNEKPEGDLLFKFFDQKARLLKPSSSQHQQAAIEVQRYVDEELLPRDKNPLEWWKNNMLNYPYLSQIAAEYLCVVGTSILDSKLYSKAGMLSFEHMTRLPSETVQELIILNVNSKLLDEYNWL